MAKYQKKLEEDIRCPLEYGLTRVLDDTEMPEDKKTESFQNLIDAILNDNREIISHEK